jgi:hypothetical protein
VNATTRRLAFRALFGYALAIAFSAFCVYPSCDVRATEVPTGPSVARITLEASQVRYTHGQPVLLRVGLINISADPFSYLTRAPWYDATITVTDTDGRVIEPTDSVEWRDFSMPVFEQLLPSAKVVLHDPMGNTWINLAKWGYSDLADGTYTITGAPRLAIRKLGAEGKDGSPTTLSEFRAGVGAESTSSVSVTISR